MILVVAFYFEKEQTFLPTIFFSVCVTFLSSIQTYFGERTSLCRCYSGEISGPNKNFPMDYFTVMYE